MPADQQYIIQTLQALHDQMKQVGLSGMHGHTCLMLTHFSKALLLYVNVVSSLYDLPFLLSVSISYLDPFIDRQKNVRV